VTLVADPDWPGPPPAFPRVRYEVIAEDEAASLAFEAGAVACTRISVNTLAAYKAMPPPNARLLTGPGARYSWLTINICHPKLTDIRIRRALQHAIDNAAVALGAYSGLVLPATGIIPPSMLGHRERVLYPPDPARARALLTEAGVTDLRLRLSILNDDASGLAAQILTSQLADIGITLDVVAHDEAVYWSLGDRQSNPDWQAIELVLMNFTGGVDPSESLTWFRPNGIGVFNWSQFDSTAFEALYQESLTEADPEHRAELTRRAQDLMEESGGFVFMVFDTYAAIHRDDIEPFITPDNFLDAPRFTRR